MADTKDDSSLGNVVQDTGQGSRDGRSEEKPEGGRHPVVDDQPSVASSSSYDSDEKTPTDEAEGGSSDKQEQKSTLEKLAENVKDTSGWGWNTLSSWGTSVLSTGTSVLSTATSSVTTFTSQVGEGLHQVLETVESKLAEPEQEEPPSADGSTTADIEPVEPSIGRSAEPTSAAEPGAVEEPEAESASTPLEDEGKNQGWFGGWGASLSEVVNKTTSVVQQTVEQTTSVSKKVVSSGLDVLETIGRKTYDVLAEGDHGLKKTIERSRKSQPNLSQALREAKEEAEEKAKEEEEFLESRKSHYGAQFDDFQGLVHLEALEMLSSMSEGKVRGLLDVLPKEASESLKSDLTKIKVTFEETSPDNDDDDFDDHDFHQLLMDYVGQLSLNVNIQKLLQCQAATRRWLLESDKLLKDDSATKHSPKEVHEKAIQSMAEFTAYSIEHFHRAGQLLLQDKTIPMTLYPTMANCLASLTKVLSKEVTWQSTLFVNCLTAIGSDQPLTETITNVYLEASNSSTYIQNSFQLLLPIIQLATIESHPTCQALAEN